MKRQLRLLVVPFLVAYLTAPTVAQERTTPGSMDPYEVLLYKKPNYEEPIGTWKLPPGKRMLKVASLDEVPRSILLGSKVSIVVFPNRDFTSRSGIIKEHINRQFYGTEYWTANVPIPYDFFVNSSSDALRYERGIWKSGPVSFLLFRNDVNNILGVNLVRANVNPPDLHTVFYPLPENADEKSVVYEKITHTGPFEMVLLTSRSAVSSLDLKNIEIVVRSPKTTVKLPDPTPKLFWNLQDYGIHTELSSFSMRYTGPIGAANYLPPTAHRAPPASPPPPPPPESATRSGPAFGTGAPTPERSVAPLERRR
jgi:hypothetical protein